MSQPVEEKQGVSGDEEIYAALMKKRATGEEPMMEQTKQLLKVFEGVYRRGMKVLDVCCGVGHFFTALSQVDPCLEYCGVDLNGRYIDTGREVFRNKPNVKLQKGDVLNLDFPDGSFDISICYTTLQHFEEYRAAVAEICRVTRGHVFLRLLLSGHTYIIKRYKTGLTDEKGEPGFVYYNIWNEAEFAGYLRQQGCKEVLIYDDEFNIKLPYVNDWDTYTFDGMQISGNIILTWKHVHGVMKEG